MPTRVSIIALAVIVIAFIVVGTVFLNAKYRNKQTPASTVQPFTVEKKDLAPNQLPQGFPKDLPVEAGSSVIQNYEATTTDGRKQSTRISTTNKTLIQAVKVYQDFFLSLSWTKISTTNPDVDTVNALFRRKDDVLLITGRTDVSSKDKTVELTLIEPKAQE